MQGKRVISRLFTTHITGAWNLHKFGLSSILVQQSGRGLGAGGSLWPQARRLLDEGHIQASDGGGWVTACLGIFWENCWSCLWPIWPVTDTASFPGRVNLATTQPVVWRPAPCMALKRGSRLPPSARLPQYCLTLTPPTGTSSQS